MSNLEEKQFGYIYMHTSPSGLSYIGKSLAAKGKRWQDHVNAAYDEKYKEYEYPLQRAIRKYGAEALKHEILEDNVPSELLAELEVLYIEKHNTFYAGYNQTKGGEGTTGERSPEARAKIAAANKERVWTDEMKQKMSQTKSGVCSKPWSIQYPDGAMETYTDLTKKDYAISKGWAVHEFTSLFSKKRVGKPRKWGKFVGIVVNNLEVTDAV